jgi:hypothetical protein
MTHWHAKFLPIRALLTLLIRIWLPDAMQSTLFRYYPTKTRFLPVPVKISKDGRPQLHTVCVALFQTTLLQRSRSSNSLLPSIRAVQTDLERVRLLLGFLLRAPPRERAVPSQPAAQLNSAITSSDQTRQWRAMTVCAW